jgi:hypothetical protein
MAAKVVDAEEDISDLKKSLTLKPKAGPLEAKDLKVQVAPVFAVPDDLETDSITRHNPRRDLKERDPPMGSAASSPESELSSNEERLRAFAIHAGGEVHPGRYGPSASFILPDRKTRNTTRDASDLTDEQVVLYFTPALASVVQTAHQLVRNNAATRHISLFNLVVTDHSSVLYGTFVSLIRAHMGVRYGSTYSASAKLYMATLARATLVLSKGCGCSAKKYNNGTACVGCSENAI